MAASVEFTSSSPSNLYQELESYNWDADKEFQTGLSAILGPNPSTSQAPELILRARCFYYTRIKGVDVDFDGYKTWRRERNLPDPQAPDTNGATAAPMTMFPPSIPVSNSQQPPAQSAPTAPSSTSKNTQQDAPYPTSFAHVVELITTGQPIPGIKEIPPTVLEGQGTQSSRSKRRKPWEKAEEQESASA